MGFVYVESGPLVRSSYIAEKGYQAAIAAMKTWRQEKRSDAARV